MSGGLAAFWNVGPDSQQPVDVLEHGFAPLQLFGISTTQPPNQNNPWDRPASFEQDVRANILAVDPVNSQIHVHDIEYIFELDPTIAWEDPDAVAASGASDFEDFKYKYFREWATWYELPAVWAREIHPSACIGIYGKQRFERDYWGFVNSTEDELYNTHLPDLQIWQHVDNEVDFYIASIYLFYEVPGSVFYMAANIEANNIKHSRPVCAYTWMRYHESGSLPGQEIAPYLAEAMAIVPFFSGAKSVVLWGFEPDSGSQQPYLVMPVYLEALSRVSVISDRIGLGELVIDESAHVLWREQRPLIRYVVLDYECIVMAINPWQRDEDNLTIHFECRGFEGNCTMHGKHVTLLYVPRFGEIVEL